MGKNNYIEISFSVIGYELSCEFVDNLKNAFTLQDALGYVDIKEFKGVYQLPRKEKVEKGIYLADAVKYLFNKIDVSDILNFNKIFKFKLDTHKKLLEDYYFETDLKSAEKYLKEGEYIKARELYEKHINSLSKVQMKQLEYIRKNE